MTNDQAPMTNERRGRPQSHWSLVIGHWSLVIGHWSLVIGHWSLVIGHWSLVIGHWSLVIGHWSLVMHSIGHSYFSTTSSQRCWALRIVSINSRTAPAPPGLVVTNRAAARTSAAASATATPSPT